MSGRRRNSAKHALISLAVINQFGSWLSFLAIILYAQQEYGSAASAIVFVAQTVPALIAARSVSDRIPLQHARRCWILGQVALGALTAALALIHTAFAAVLIYVALSMLLKAILSPLYMSLMVGSVPQDQRRATMTGVGAAGSIAIVVAPALGGVLLSSIGPTWLFLLNATTYFLVALLMLVNPRLRAQDPSAGAQAAPRSLWSSIPSPRSLLLGPGDNARFVLRDPVLAAWVLLLAVGALLNGLETPYSFDVLHMSQPEFGRVLACFGLGGLVVLILSSVRDTALIGPRWAVVLYGGGLLAWLLGGDVGAYLGFFVAGFGGAHVSGWIRARLDQWSDSRGLGAQQLWGWANQTTLFVNLVVYSAVSVTFLMHGSSVVLAGILMVLFVPFFAVVAACVRQR